MANANISHVTLSNTFSDWRGATNNLANSANELRNGNYYKDTGPLLNIKNGRLSIDRTSGVSLNVAANANVQSNFTTRTKIVLEDATYSGDDARFANSKVIVDIANTLAVKNLTSNAFIHSVNANTTELIVGSDTSGNCWIQGDPYPAKTPLYVNGEFQSLDRGFNFYGNSIASVIVTANVANNKIADFEIDVPLLDGDSGVKGQKGQKGQPGVQGGVGVQGSIGAQGYQGVQGSVGYQGSKGLTGDSIGGDKGAKGDKGEFGYGQLGDDGQKGQKGESVGATKGEKGAKGDRGVQGDPGYSPTKGQKGDTGDAGNAGGGGESSISPNHVMGYVNWANGVIPIGSLTADGSVTSVLGYSTTYPSSFGSGLYIPKILSSNNISSLTLTAAIWNWGGVRAGSATFTIYEAQFATQEASPPGETPGANQAYAIIGTMWKLGNYETAKDWNASGNIQIINRNHVGFKFAHAITGSAVRVTEYITPAFMGVAAIRSPGANGNPLYPTNWYDYNLPVSGVPSGGGGSVSINAYMPLYDNKYAKDMVAGDNLLLLDPNDNSRTSYGTVISNRISEQKLVTLVSVSGIRLTCSDNTPLTLENGEMINSTEAKGHKLPVQDENGFRWEEIVDVLDAGSGEVATIYCDNQCYGAGDTLGKYIWTHNYIFNKV